MDYRGVGRSSNFDCTPNPFEDIEGCVKDTLKNDANLAGITTTNTAYDALHLIGSTLDASGGARAFIVGTSFGSYVGVRTLVVLQDAIRHGAATLRASMLGGVVLDGFAPPELLRTPRIDVAQRNVALDLLARCQAMPSCARRFNDINNNNDGDGDVLRVAYDTLFRAERRAISSCAAFVDQRRLATGLDALINDFYARQLIPPLLLRMNRCNASLGDVDAVRRAFPPPQQCISTERSAFRSII
jgi:pimeloyl-ACP methyl ester carboxylesterase